MQVCASELYIYISGVRSLGHRVKPNMAANGGPNLRQSQSPYAVFQVYVYSKNCAGGLKPTQLRASMSAIFVFTFCPVGDRKISLHISIYIYIYVELTGIFIDKCRYKQKQTSTIYLGNLMM